MAGPGGKRNTESDQEITLLMMPAKGYRKVVDSSIYHMELSMLPRSAFSQWANSIYFTFGSGQIAKSVLMVYQS